VSVVSSTATVTTTRTLLGSPRDSRKQLTVSPDASVTVYIGGPTVTSANGFPLAPGDDPFDVYSAYLGDKAAAQAFYAVTASGSATVHVTEVVF
jgi:hypothetical protein